MKYWLSAFSTYTCAAGLEAVDVGDVKETALRQTFSAHIMFNVAVGRAVPLRVVALRVSDCAPPDAILGRSASTGASIAREAKVSVGLNEPSSKPADFEAMAYVTCDEHSDKSGSLMASVRSTVLTGAPEYKSIN